MKTINERTTEVSGTAPEMIEWSPARKAKVEALARRLVSGDTGLVEWSSARIAKVEALALKLREGISFVVTDYPFAIHQS